MDETVKRKRSLGWKTAYMGMLTALAILVGYVETLIPVNFGIPGMKIGLSNIVILIVIYLYSWREAIAVSAVRVVVIGFLFGNLFSIQYGMAGAVCSMLAMSVLIRIAKFGTVGISAAGGAAHNVGQILVACVYMPSIPFFWYLPLLLIAGTLTGIVNGFVVYAVYRRLPEKGRDIR
jgi:heptaprenyl diphosphate synthase